MSDRRRFQSVGVTVGAIVVALANALFIVATTTSNQTSTAQLAGGGFVILVFSVMIGWSAGVGLAALPILGAAVVEIATGSGEDWLRATIVGALWFCAAELAWDAIDRRDGHERTRAANRRRLEEVATVVAVTFAVVLVSLALLAQAPPRTLLIQFLVLGIAVSAMVATGRHLARTGPDEGPGTNAAVAGRDRVRP